MTGGGARAAYQVGVLRYLARRHPALEVPYLTGVSAGAINAAYLAGRSGTFAEGVAGLEALWSQLRMEHVIRVGVPSLVARLLRWGLCLVSGGAGAVPQSMVDTAPLRRFLEGHLCAGGGSHEIGCIGRNIASGRIEALAMTTTSYGSGRSTTWVQGRDVALWDRPLRTSAACTFTVDHVMASAALPLLFPAVRLEEEWHGDGGIREMAPLSPALHLGARRILAIATRSSALPSTPAASGAVGTYPPPARVAGLLLNAVFLDALDHDAIQMNRINEILERVPDPLRNGLRPVDLLVMRPSQDLGVIAAEHEPELPRFLRYLMRGWGTRQRQGSDPLALLMFEPGYVRRLIDLGERDAAARADEIERFLSLG